MKEDTFLIVTVFLVWAVLAILYYTVPMIYMPTTGRVWGLGAVLFLALAVIVWLAQRKGKTRRGEQQGIGGQETT